MISAYTFTALSFEEFQTKFKHALNTINFKPTLAFTFVSVSFPLTRIMDLFKAQQIALFGTTTGGEILLNTETIHIDEKSAVVVFTDIPAQSFRLHLIKQGDSSSYALGVAAGKKIKTAFPNPSALLGASGILLDGQALVEGIVDQTGEKMPLFGGLAGDDGHFEKTFVFDGDKCQITVMTN